MSSEKFPKQIANHDYLLIRTVIAGQDESIGQEFLWLWQVPQISNVILASQLATFPVEHFEIVKLLIQLHIENRDLRVRYIIVTDWLPLV
jgi:hypothetical protein